MIFCKRRWCKFSHLDTVFKQDWDKAANTMIDNNIFIQNKTDINYRTLHWNQFDKFGSYPIWTYKHSNVKLLYRQGWNETWSLDTRIQIKWDANACKITVLKRMNSKYKKHLDTCHPMVCVVHLQRWSAPKVYSTKKVGSFEGLLKWRWHKYSSQSETCWTKQQKTCSRAQVCCTHISARSLSSKRFPLSQNNADSCVSIPFWWLCSYILYWKHQIMPQATMKPLVIVL